MAKAKDKPPMEARTRLLLVWAGFFLLNLALVLYFYFDGWIEGDNFKAALQQLNASYAPYLGAILLYYFGSAQSPQPAGGGLPLHLALAGSVLWNGLLLIFLLFLPIEEAIAYIKDVGGLFAWLVAGAIGYYFAQTATAAEPPASGK